jgi:hypothetical protein
MTVRLYHPTTEAEFSAPESAVPQYQRAGWVVKADMAGPNGNGRNPGTAGAGTTKAGKAEAAKTEE